MTNPNIQIDDEVRKMTDDEYAAHLQLVNETQNIFKENTPE